MKIKGQHHKWFPYLLQTFLLIFNYFTPSSSMTITGAVITMTAFGISFHPHSPQFKLLLKIIFGVVGTLFLFTSEWSFASIEMGAQILLLLSSLKLFELKEYRDASTYVAITHLLFLTLLLQVDQLILLPLIFATVLSSLWFLARSSDLKSSLNILLSKLALASMIATAILFFLFPRFQFGGIRWFSNLQLGLTGHSEVLRPGDIAKLINDQEIVFRASFDSPKPLQELYWRGATLHQTDGFNWEKGRYRGSQRVYTEALYSYQVDFDNRYNGDLFTLNGTSKISLNRLGNAIRTSEEDWMAITAQPKKLHFEAIRSDYTDSAPHPQSIDKLLLYPKQAADRIVLQTIEEIKLLYPVQNPNPAQKVEATVRFFTDHNFSYTLNPGQLDSLSDFLKNKQGFCGHYASAMGALLRLQNIPTRVVTGYQGGQFNSLGNYYIVRQQDAHAWNEYWNGKKWVLLDMTELLAPNRIFAGSESYFNDGVFNRESNQDLNYVSYLGRFKLFLDLAYYKVNTRFSNYDAQEQRKIFQNIIKMDKTQLLRISFKIVLYILITVLGGLLVKRLWKLWKTPPLTPWQLVHKIYQKKSMSLPQTITPRQLANQLQNPQLIELLQQIERDSYDHTAKVKRKELILRIKKLKSLF